MRNFAQMASFVAAAFLLASCTIKVPVNLGRSAAPGANDEVGLPGLAGEDGGEGNQPQFPPSPETPSPPPGPPPVVEQSSPPPIMMRATQFVAPVRTSAGVATTPTLRPGD